MVPQDCVLFNDSIRYNIRYGHMAAADEQVEQAAEAACIHEAITTRFPKVRDLGEEGLKGWLGGRTKALDLRGLCERRRACCTMASIKNICSRYSSRSGVMQVQHVIQLAAPATSCTVMVK
jgi:hypothetical protein